MFSTDLIQQLARDEIFRRGEKYYREGRLRKITQSGHSYQAEVSGSQPYYIQLSFEAGNIHAYCSCPYEGEGWCKHLVATALGIQEGAVEEIPNQSVGLEPLSAFVSKYVRSAKSYHTFGFLEQLMGKNPHLQAEFLRYTRSLPGPLVDIPKQAATWRVLVQDQGEEMEEEVNSQCLTPLLEALDAGQYDTAGQYWLAAYEAYLHSKGPARERAQRLVDLFSSHMENVLRESIFPPALAKRLIQMAFSRWDHHQQHQKQTYRWPHLAFLLELLCADMVTAQFLRHKLDAYGLNDPFLIPLKERITEILG